MVVLAEAEHLLHRLLVDEAGDVVEGLTVLREEIPRFRVKEVQRDDVVMEETLQKGLDRIFGTEKTAESPVTEPVADPGIPSVVSEQTQILIDNDYIMASLGVLSKEHEASALLLLKKSIGMI